MRVLAPDAIERARSEQARGSDPLLGMPLRMGLGFWLSQPDVPGFAFGPNEGAFGHPGAGGSLGFADPAARVGFGYVTNRMGSDIAIDARAAGADRRGLRGLKVLGRPEPEPDGREPREERSVHRALQHAAPDRVREAGNAERQEDGGRRERGRQREAPPLRPLPERGREQREAEAAAQVLEQAEGVVDAPGAAGRPGAARLAAREGGDPVGDADEGEEREPDLRAARPGRAPGRRARRTRARGRRSAGSRRGSRAGRSPRRARRAR